MNKFLQKWEFDSLLIEDSIQTPASLLLKQYLDSNMIQSFEYRRDTIHHRFNTPATTLPSTQDSIIIDSIHPILLTAQNPSKALKELLKNKGIIIIYHSDIKLSNRINYLEFLRQNTQAQIQIAGDRLNLTVKKESGKIEHCTSKFSINPFTLIANTYNSTSINTSASSSSTIDPISTFDLSLDLNERERGQRGAVELPFKKLIHYEVEVEDEDEDDDLEI